MLAGESVSSLVFETSLPEQTLYRWKHQAPVDHDLVDSVNSAENAELRSANKRIKVLEIEFQLVKDASKLFDAPAAVPQKASGRSRRTSKARPFDSFRQPSIGDKQVNLYRMQPKPTDNREIPRLLVADAIGQVHENSRAA